ncbi:MAG: hypothetical protein IRZ09_03475 [Variibacter sp.]|nr:hypothetical protein [Variibacter sp.]
MSSATASARKHAGGYFVNLSVSDRPRSKAFFERLGFSFHPQFTNDAAATLVVWDAIFAM